MESGSDLQAGHMSFVARPYLWASLLVYSCPHRALRASVAWYQVILGSDHILEILEGKSESTELCHSWANSPMEVNWPPEW
jgi:hypothetical protein